MNKSATRGILYKMGSTIFPVLPNERLLVGYFIAYAFCLGAIQVLAYTASHAIFLARLGTQMLPYAYIGGSLATVFAGTIYGRLEHKIRRRTIIILNLSLISATFLLFWFILGANADQVPAWALLVWCDIVFVTISLAFWPLANQVFDLRQSKRLFGLISASMSLAEITAGVSTSVLLIHLGVTDLLLMAAMAAVLSLIPLSVILRRWVPTEHVIALPNPRVVPVDRQSESLRSPYVQGMFALTSLAWLTFYLLDNAFFDLFSKFYQDETQLGVILGLFFASSSSLTLFIRAFLTRPILARFGVKGGLLVTPFFLTVCLVATLAFGAVLGTVPLVVSLLAISKLLDRSLSTSVDQVSFLVLYQPLPKNERGHIQTKIEAVIDPLVGGVAGIALLMMGLIARPTAFTICLVALAVLVAWLVVAIWVGKAYPLMLRRALELAPDILTSRPISKNMDSNLIFQILYEIALIDSELAILETQFSSNITENYITSQKDWFDMERRTERLFLMLPLHHDEPLFLKIFLGLGLLTADHQAYALELLELTVPRRIGIELVPMCERLSRIRLLKKTTANNIMEELL